VSQSRAPLSLCTHNPSTVAERGPSLVSPLSPPDAIGIPRARRKCKGPLFCDLPRASRRVRVAVCRQPDVRGQGIGLASSDPAGSRLSLVGGARGREPFEAVCCVDAERQSRRRSQRRQGARHGGPLSLVAGSCADYDEYSNPPSRKRAMHALDTSAS
jgi:hypothetical protein